MIGTSHRGTIQRSVEGARTGREFCAHSLAAHGTSIWCSLCPEDTDRCTGPL
ncbi:unnamed protein product, partial [Staurois parvus]